MGLLSKYFDSVDFFSLLTCSMSANDREEDAREIITCLDCITKHKQTLHSILIRMHVWEPVDLVMSANYFVDSLINNDPQEVLKANAHFTDMCSTPFLSADCSHLSSCSFASKNAVFASSWDPIYSQKSMFYAKHPAIGANSRFLQPWIEPAVSSRNYDLNSDDFPDTRHKENSGYFYKPSTPTKIQQINSSPLSSGKNKEDKAEIDPSKLLTLHLLP